MADLTLKLGNGTWECQNFQTYESDNETYPYHFDLDCGYSTIKMVLSDGWFIGSGKIYYNLWITNDCAPIIGDSNTFNDIKIDAGLQLSFWFNTTQTVNTFTAVGSYGSLITLRPYADDGLFLSGAVEDPGTGYHVGDVCILYTGQEGTDTSIRVDEINEDGGVTAFTVLSVGTTIYQNGGPYLMEGENSVNCYVQCQSVTVLGQFTLSKSSGVISCDYLNISNSVATGGATWNAGSHSVDSGNNSGWIFTNPPTSSAEKIRNYISNSISI